MLLIGIDPGATTGYATWDATEKRLAVVTSMKIHHAMQHVQRAWLDGKLHTLVIEDARLRVWFGSKGAEALQGAGSIKRDCTIWADFLADLGCPVLSLKPQAGATKWTAERFRQATGWAERTNEHARDAAMLVYQRAVIGTGRR